MVIIERPGKPRAALVNDEDLERFLQQRQRAQEAWERLDAIAARNSDLDPDYVFSLVTQEVQAMRRERRERGV